MSHNPKAKIPRLVGAQYFRQKLPLVCNLQRLEFIQKLRHSQCELLLCADVLLLSDWPDGADPGTYKAGPVAGTAVNKYDKVSAASQPAWHGS